MRNPWLAKNPFLSAWYSAANTVAASARGHVTAAAHQEVARLHAAATQQVVEFWTGAWLAPTAPKRHTRKRR